MKLSNRFPKWATWIGLLLCVVLLGFIDYLTGHEFNFFLPKPIYQTP